ncbi:MAG: L,D-transpeptidase [Chloroflexota bacterium]
MHKVFFTWFILTALLLTPSVAAAQAAPFCAQGQAPQLGEQFSELQAWVGDRIGAPLECPHVDAGSGDTHQQTANGLAYFQPDSQTAVFTDGWRHWALVDGRQVTWAGQSPTPPVTAFEPDTIDAIDLPGRIVGTFNIRSYPQVTPETLVRQLGHNTAVWVSASVRGADGDAWYRIGDGEYVHSSGVRLPTPPPEMPSGRWIDADLTIPAMVTAYEDGRAVYAALAIPGTKAFQTPTGTFQILRRVQNETMDSATIGIPRNSPNGYFLEDVLYTQYFTWDGASLHYNWWKGTFGYPGSHGCLGLNREDAEWFWDWAAMGTTLKVRH